MKSELFREHPDVSKTFAEHVAIVAKVQFPDGIRQRLPGILSQLVFASTSRDEARIIAELRSEWPLPADELQALLGVGHFFLRNVGENDTADVIVEDLPALTGLSEDDAASLHPFVASLVEEAQRSFKDLRRIYRTQISGLKVIQGITHLMDLRAVIPNAGDMDSGIESYHPKIQRLVPVAILKLRFDDNEEAVFQMDERTLDLLLEDIMQLKKEFQATVSFIPGDKVHPGRRREA